MKIGEMEQLTGITKKNIRFYEKEGLLTPRRNEENRYREYDSQDVETLLQIKLFRKLGVPIEGIKAVLNQELSLNTCLDQQIHWLEESMTQMKDCRKVCGELIKKQATLETLPVQQCLSQMEQEEKAGAKFMNLAKDFLLAMRTSLFWQYYYEPEEPVLDTKDMVREVQQFAQQRGFECKIIYPALYRMVVELNGVLYHVFMMRQYYTYGPICFHAVTGEKARKYRQSGALE